MSKKLHPIIEKAFDDGTVILIIFYLFMLVLMGWLLPPPSWPMNPIWLGIASASTQRQRR